MPRMPPNFPPWAVVEAGRIIPLVRLVRRIRRNEKEWIPGGLSEHRYRPLYLPISSFVLQRSSIDISSPRKRLRRFIVAMKKEKSETRSWECNALLHKHRRNVIYDATRFAISYLPSCVRAFVSRARACQRMRARGGIYLVARRCLFSPCRRSRGSRGQFDEHRDLLLYLLQIRVQITRI